MTWIIAGYLAVGFLFALIVRPLTPVAWITQIALWPLALLVLLILLRETTRMGEIVVTALWLLPLVLLLSWHLGVLS
jgi:hypothetical protein